MPHAVLPSTAQPSSDREEEPLADIAPPAESDEHDSNRACSTCVETAAPETAIAPPSAADVHREKRVEDTDT